MKVREKLGRLLEHRSTRTHTQPSHATIADIVYQRGDPTRRLREITREQNGLYSIKAARLAQVRPRLTQEDTIPDAVCLSTEMMESILTQKLPATQRRTLLKQALQTLEQEPAIAREGLKLGNSDSPLVISVRSGGAKFMAGLLPTIQGIGLSDSTVEAFGRGIQDSLAAWKLYYKFVRDFAHHVRGIPQSKLPPEFPAPPNPKQIKSSIRSIEKLMKGDRQFPQVAFEQLDAVVTAIANSWDSKLAKEFRIRHGVDSRPVTAGILQHQKVGLGARSCAAVIYGANRTTGQNEITGQWLQQATGDDIMTGSERQPGKIEGNFSIRWTKQWKQIQEIVAQVTEEFKFPPELEVIVEGARVFLLQARPMMPASQLAGLRICLNLAEQEILNGEELVNRVDEAALYASIQSPSLKRPDNFNDVSLFTGNIEASGVARGQVIWNEKDLLKKPLGKKFILVTGRLDPQLWDEIFDRVSGIVLTEHPGAHFSARAQIRQVAVISDYSANVTRDKGNLVIRHKGASPIYLTPGETVSLDAFGGREHGYLARGDLETRPERPLAKLVREYREGKPLRSIDDFPDRQRQQAELLIKYWAIKEKVVLQRRTTTPESVVERLSEEPVWMDPGQTLTPIKYLWKIFQDAGWIEEKQDTKGPPQFKLSADASVCFRSLLSTQIERRKVFECFIATTYDEHQRALALVRSIPIELIPRFLQGFVRNMNRMGRSPGREGGIYLFTRILGLFESEREIHAIAENVHHAVLRYIVSENYAFHTEMKQAQAEPDKSRYFALLGIAERHPLFQFLNFSKFVRRHLTIEQKDAILDDADLSNEVKQWFERTLNVPSKSRELRIESSAEVVRQPGFRLSHLKEVMKERGLVDEKVPYAVSQARHDGTYDADSLNFKYQFAPSFSSAFLDPILQDPEALQALTASWVDLDLVDHAFLIQFLEAFPQFTQHVPLMAQHARAIGRSPGRGCGDHILTRLFVGLEGNLNLENEDLLYLVEDLAAFYRIYEATSVSDAQTKRHQQEVRMLERLQPELKEKNTILARFERQAPKGWINATLNNAALSQDARAAIAQLFGLGEEFKKIIAIETASTQFRLADFMLGLRSNSEEIAKKLHAYPLAIPNFEIVRQMFKQLGWGSFEYQVSSSKFQVCQLDEKAGDLFATFCQLSPARAVSLLLNSDYEDREIIQQLMQRVSSEIQIGLIRNVVEALIESREPGWTSQFFLSARLALGMARTPSEFQRLLDQFSPLVSDYIQRDVANLQANEAYLSSTDSEIAHQIRAEFRLNT